MSSSPPSSHVSPARLPVLLGLGGLVPFVALSLALVLGFTVPLFEDADSMRVALVGYGVVILSFLGGVRWGIAIKETDAGNDKAARDFVIAVMPALLGWFAWFQPSPADLWWLAAAHVVLGLLDYGLACRVIVPEWYGRLRLGLAGIAALCLMVTAIVAG